MRLVTFTTHEQQVHYGVRIDTRILDLNAGYARYRRMRTGNLTTEVKFGPDLRAFIEQGPEAWHLAEKIIDAALAMQWENLAPGESDQTPLFYAAEAVQLLAPLSNPSKIVAIGLNYADHCREQNIDPPKAPILFAKYPSAIIGPGEAITWDPGLTQQVDYEAELAVVIGRRARNVSPEGAFDYVFGYTALNDVSARDLQFGDGQWVRGKSLDTFCPLGPAIVTRDEIAGPQDLGIRCLINGRPLQDSNTGEMIFDIPYLIAFISHAITLLPGDIIATGTPHGVGVFRDPQVFLKHGDRVRIEIEGLDALENPVVLEGADK